MLHSEQIGLWLGVFLFALLPHGIGLDARTILWMHRLEDLGVIKVAPAFTAWLLQLRAHRGLQRELFAKQACVVSLLAAASPGRVCHAS